MSSPAATRDRDWKPDFLAGLRTFGNVLEACEVVGIARRTAYNARDTDDAFSQDWSDALADFTDRERSVVSKELHRRAVEGVDEPVFFMGAKVAEVKKYSDSLLALKVKMLFGDLLREKVDVSHSGNVSNNLDREAARRLLLDPVAAKLANDLERRFNELADGGDAPAPSAE